MDNNMIGFTSQILALLDPDLEITPELLDLIKQLKKFKKDEESKPLTKTGIGFHCGNTD